MFLKISLYFKANERSCYKSEKCAENWIESYNYVYGQILDSSVYDSVSKPKMNP